MSSGPSRNAKEGMQVSGDSPLVDQLAVRTGYMSSHNDKHLTPKTAAEHNSTGQAALCTQHCLAPGVTCPVRFYSTGVPNVSSVSLSLNAADKLPRYKGEQNYRAFRESVATSRSSLALCP